MVDNSKFYVVQFLELPYENIKRYVCVPNSWVRLRNSKDRKVYVAYPIEDPVKTRKRGDNNETPGKDWKLFLALIKYESDDCDDAYFWISTQEVDDSTDDEVIIIKDEYSTDNNDFDIAMKHNKVSSGNGSSNWETRGNQLATSMAPHSSRINTSTKPNVKPQMIVAPVRYNENIRIELSPERPLSPNGIFCNQLQYYNKLNRENKSMNKSRHLSNSLEDSGKEKNLPFHNNFFSRPQEMVIGKFTTDHDIDGRASSITSTNNMTVATPTFLNQSHQSSESLHQQRISVVSEDILRYGYDKQRPIPGRSIKNNSNDQRSQEMTPAIQTLTNIMKQRSQVAQTIQHENTFLNENYLHQEKRKLKITDRPTEVNYIGQRTYRQDVAKNKKSTVQKSTNSTNFSRPLSERSQKKQHPPAYNDTFTQNSDTNKGLRFIDDENSYQGNKLNAPTAMKNLSNVTNQPGHSHEKQCPPAYNILVQQDSQVKKIIITRSAEGESNDQRLSSQGVTQSTSLAEQNFLNIANQLSQMSERSSEKNNPPVLPEHIMNQNSCTKNPVIRTVAGNLINLPIVSQYDAKCAFSTEYFPRIENRFNQLSKSSNENTSADLQNDVRQVTRIARLLAGESTAANYIYKNCGLQRTLQNTPSVVTSFSNSINQSHQISENSRQYDVSLPVPKKSMLHDACNKPLLLRKATEANSVDQRLLIESIAPNVPPTVQTIPISSNQIGQYFRHSSNNQEALDYRNFKLPNIHPQRMFLTGPNEMIDTNQIAYQSIPQDISSAVQDPLNLATHSCCSCKCSRRRQFSSVTSSHSLQDKLIQSTLISRSTERNYDRQSIYSENNTEHKSAAKQNPTNLENNQQLSTQGESSGPRSNAENRQSAQCYPDLVNQSLKSSMDKHSPMNIDSSDKAICTEKTHTNDLISTNASGQSSRLESNTVDKSMASQNSSNVFNGSKSVREKAEQLMNHFKLIFLKINSSLSAQNKAVDDIRDANVEYSKLLKKVMDRINEHCTLGINETLGRTSKNVAKIRNKQQTRKEVLKYNYVDIDDDNVEIYEDDSQHDNNNDEYYKPPNKKVRQKRLFDLPSEYDPNNTRWTLKHQKLGPGIVEVLPQSRVYIDAIKFQYSKRTARDCKTLARMLLTEIFSRDALRVCSLTGARARAFDCDGTNVRPGLDENARMVLLTCVEDYGRSHGWIVYDQQSVLNSLRSKIQELRSKPEMSKK